MQRQFWFNLSISYPEFEHHYYAEGVKQLLVRDDNGVTIAIPCGRFVPFIGARGITGRFCLTIDEQGRFLDLNQIK